MPERDPATAEDRAPAAALPLLMIDLLSAVYWFDEALQAGLKAHGWSEVTRGQSLVLANIAAGVNRAVHLARNLGVSRQAMSQTLAEMEARGLVAVSRDPDDRRAMIVTFSPDSGAIRDDAVRVLRTIEEALASRIGAKRMEAVRGAMAEDWGPSPVSLVTAAAGAAAEVAPAKPPAGPRSRQA